MNDPQLLKIVVAGVDNIPDYVGIFNPDTNLYTLIVPIGLDFDGVEILEQEAITEAEADILADEWLVKEGNYQLVYTDI